MGRFPLRIPKHTHEPDYRLVPVSGCGCTTCCDARIAKDNAADDAHYGKVGNVLGLQAQGGCACGRASTSEGYCIAWWQCEHSPKPPCEGTSDDCTGIAVVERTRDYGKPHRFCAPCDASEKRRQEDGPSDDQVANGHGMEGGIRYDPDFESRVKR